MSTLARRHVTHMFEGFCRISVPHIQHKIIGIVAAKFAIIAQIASKVYGYIDFLNTTLAAIVGLIAALFSSVLQLRTWCLQ